MENNLIVYESDDGQVSFDVPIDLETVWLTQKQMAELFEVTVATINEHIKNVLRYEQLNHSVIRKFRITASDGKTYSTNHYNLDVIISVGYRVNSLRGVQFRKWATEQLKHLLLNGYAYNLKKIEALEETVSWLAEKQGVNDSKFMEIAEMFASLQKGILDIKNNIRLTSE